MGMKHIRIAGKFFRVCGALALGGWALACVEVNVRGEIRQDGSGTLHVSQSFVKDFADGGYAELSTNRLFPTDETGVARFVEGFSGAKLMAVNVSDQADALSLRGRKLAARRVEYSFAFDDINAIKTNHMRFAYYPYGDNSYFQFRIDKKVSADHAGPVNPIIGTLTEGQYLKMSFDMPAKLENTNGFKKSTQRVEWEIPMQAILDDLQPSIVAWAQMPKWDMGAAQALWQGLSANFFSAAWRNPANLPTHLVVNSKFNQTSQ